MDRVYDSGVSATPTDLPAAPETGYPIAGDPLTATPATKPGAYWFYMITESLRNLIVDAGLTPDHEDLTLVLDAIDTKISTAITNIYPLPPKHISGCEISNNATDAVYDIDIAVGKAKSSDDAYDIAVTSAIGKRIDAVWATAGTPGTTTGGRASGVSLVAGWYRVFLIAKTDGTVNAGFDTSATAANLLADATGYTKYRQIGWVYYTGSTIAKFSQDGDEFTWDVPAVDINAASGSSAGVAVTLTVPPLSRARFTGHCYSGSALQFIIFTEIAQTNTAPVSGQFDLVANASDYAQAAEFVRKADASSQIRQRATGSSTGYSIFTKGWTDFRGK